jgi:O-antigen/teichoic acid export membrane protein
MSSLFSHASWGGVSAAIRLVFGVGSLFLSIRLAGAEFYGYLALMLSVTAFYVAFINSVHTIAVTRAAEYRSMPEVIADRTRLFSAVWLVTLLSVALLVLLALPLGPAVIRTFVYTGDDAAVVRQLADLQMLVIALAACQLLVAGNVAVIEGLGRFDLAARAQIFGPPATFVLLATGFVTNASVDIVDVGRSYLLGTILELAVTTWVRLRMGYRHALLPSTQALVLIPELLRHGLMLQGASLVNIFFDPFNKFLLNHFVGPASVTAYEIATKIVAGIRGLFGGAFRVFLQLSDKLGADGGEDYLKVMRYGMVPAMLMHGAGCVLMVLLSRFWLGSEMDELSLFYFLLIPSSIGIIFAAPLYGALIGIRDLAFIFRMHVNLAVLNLLASSLLIPFLGLYGAGVGLTLTTAYNAAAEYRRYISMIGPIPGFGAEVGRLKSRFAGSVALTLAALAADYVIQDVTILVAVEAVVMTGFAVLFLMEPLTARVMSSVLRRRGSKQ